MTAKELFTNAFNNNSYHIDEIVAKYDYIQCNYSFERNSYFLRISDKTLINGRIGGDDGRGYASGLSVDTLSYLISHFKDVKSLQ
jgi:hypothetical protein